MPTARKQLISVENKLLFLAETFVIGICVYAVLSKHNHLVLFVNEKKSNKGELL